MPKTHRYSENLERRSKHSYLCVTDDEMARTGSRVDSEGLWLSWAHVKLTSSRVGASLKFLTE